VAEIERRRGKRGSRKEKKKEKKQIQKKQKREKVIEVKRVAKDRRSGMMKKRLQNQKRKQRSGFQRDSISG